MSQLETADRQAARGADVPAAKVTRLKDKIAKLKEEIARLNAINTQLQASEDKQISLTDPDARSMATSGKDTGIVGYNVQAAVDTTNHLIVAHEVTNIGTDRHQLANMAEQARAEMGAEKLEVVADRGYYEGDEIKACEDAGITVTLPKPQTSGAKAEGRFGKQDFVYVAAEDVYRCPAGEQLTYPLSSMRGRQDDPPLLDEQLQDMPAESAVHDRRRAAHRTLGARGRAGESPGRLDHNPDAMRSRRSTAEHPFGTIKCWMGWTHFLCTTLPKVATEMALNVLAYNMKRVIAIMGVGALLEAMAA